MKERPILFSAESIKTILEDRKTQTRRVIKQATGAFWDHRGYEPFVDADGFILWREVGSKIQILPNWAPHPRCPYGHPGDRLWVRETWAHDSMHCKDVTCGNEDHIWWKANEVPIVADSFAGDAHWRSPIYMPRWASRITLEITAVRVEQLQEISDHDALAEGAIKNGSAAYFFPGIWDHFRKTPSEAFSDFWDLINAKRGYSWFSHPWVWVIEFKRVEPSPVEGDE